MSRYENFAADVLIDLTRRFAQAARRGDSEGMKRIVAGLKCLEAEYPDAEAEIQRLYGQKE